MGKHPVIIGWPVSLAIRGLNVARGIGSAATAAGATFAATTALATVAPWANSMVNNANKKSEETDKDPLLNAGNALLNSVLAFLDMNANNITVNERRRMAVVSIPGRESDFLQGMGGHTVRYRLEGKFYDRDPSYFTHKNIMQTILKTTIGNSAVGSTQMLRLLMRQDVPVPFSFEHDIAMAIISDFQFDLVGGEPNYVRYAMELYEVQRIPYLAKMAILGTGNLVSNLIGD